MYAAGNKVALTGHFARMYRSQPYAQPAYPPPDAPPPGYGSSGSIPPPNAPPPR
jgi:hypothetical protein